MRIIQTLLYTLLVVCIGTTTLCAKIHYVTVDGTGNGSSWLTAAADLRATLAAAKAGDQIWVAAGRYTPARHDRAATFFIPTGVAVYGGFAGTETQIDERRPHQHRTILSGELGRPGIADNSYTVVTFRSADAQTILDGVTITGGNADADADSGQVQSSGGGLFNDAATGQSQPRIVNCLFEYNEARNGGAVYNYGHAGVAAPVFTNCIFRKNTADMDGGAVLNDGRDGGQCNVVFTDCTFEENLATYGSAICMSAGNRDSKVVLTNCLISRNAALLWGGGLYGLLADQFEFELSYNQFVDNHPTNVNKRYQHSQPLDQQAVLQGNR